MAPQPRSVDSGVRNEVESIELTEPPRLSDKESLIRTEEILELPSKNRPTTRLLNAWLFELLSSFTALVIFAFVCYILRKYEDRPNPS